MPGGGTAVHADGGAVITFTPELTIDDEVDRLTAAKVGYAGGISDHPWARIAASEDSEGNDLQLYGPPKE